MDLRLVARTASRLWSLEVRFRVRSFERITAAAVVRRSISDWSMRTAGRRRRSGHGSMLAHVAVRLTGTCPGAGTVQAASIPAGTGGAEFRGELCKEPWLTGPSRSGFRCGPDPRRHAVFVAGAWRRVPTKWSGRRNPHGRRCDECGWRRSDCGRSKRDRWDSHLPACERAAHVRGGAKRSFLADADCESPR